MLAPLQPADILQVKQGQQNPKMGQRGWSEGAAGPGLADGLAAWASFSCARRCLEDTLLSSNPSSSLTCSVTWAKDFTSLGLSFFLWQMGCWYSYVRSDQRLKEPGRQAVLNNVS